ncbi:YpjP family protein [Fervidibacillus halotolerans]|uniref:YpjP family protein n=1 Tax=Fervidibacillus halotolerans TaxID=2980027 RepID=A0A9E8RXZ4_9BACI|nr:YpjP family protein [Fervidibacillus halotolerans]WAA13275.1 YpjP family protein [Fervidibacillus halotolerans]
MKSWLYKFFVAIITFLTFGLVSPYQVIHAINPPLGQDTKEDLIDDRTDPDEELSQVLDEKVESSVPLRDQFLSETIELGEKQAMQKFGPKIAPVIEEEFQTMILPKIEESIREISEQFSEDQLEDLTVSEIPGGGVSEKIFHIYSEKTGQDIIRFHVRRELKPLEGYWFDFHYHTYHDHFQTHYELGRIFWDKNTPPNWNRYYN